MACFLQSLAAVKDLITICAAFFAGYIAFQGLSTWKRQLSGNSQHELARRWILSALKLRDKVEHVRRGGGHTTEEMAEFAKGGVLLDGLSGKERIRATTLADYAMRSNALNAVLSELNINSLEAQVLWGNAARETFFEVSNVTNRLLSAIRVEHEVLRLGLDDDPRERAKRMKVLMPLAKPPENDELMVELNAAIAKIEEIGKPHLIR
jgi:hypothetical protein